MGRECVFVMVSNVRYLKNIAIFVKREQNIAAEFLKVQ